jgi:hypothetical protein
MFKERNIMKKFLLSLKRIGQRIGALFPTRLPIGMTEFDEWAKSIIELTDLPDNDSMRFSLSTMVLHLSSTSGYKSKEFFIRSLYKAAANQIAAAKLHEIKERNKPDSTNPPTAA